VGKEAYRGAFGERPELGPQVRALGTTGLYVLPSTSPANAAVPYAERLRWFRDLAAWVDAPERSAVRAIVLDPDDRLLLARFEHPVTHESWWAMPGGGILDGESETDALRRELLEETGITEFEAGPPVWRRAQDFAWLGRLLRQRERFYLVRTGGGEPAPTVDLAAEGVAEIRWWTLDDLEAADADDAKTFWFAPRALVPALRDLLRDGPPAEPYDVGI
jgi:8-oxo-dGTP pyrophosphatase MutT (NUDIX family)